MPAVDAVDGKIVIRTQYHERHLIQQVPGSRYDRSTGHWTAPLSWATCVILRGIFADDLSIGSELTAWSWQIFSQRIEPALELRDALTLDNDDPISRVIDTVEQRTKGDT